MLQPELPLAQYPENNWVSWIRISLLHQICCQTNQDSWKLSMHKDQILVFIYLNYIQITTCACFQFFRPQLLKYKSYPDLTLSSCLSQCLKAQLGFSWSYFHFRPTAVGSGLNVIFSGLKAAQVWPSHGKLKANYGFITTTPLKAGSLSFWKRISMTGALLRGGAAPCGTCAALAGHGPEDTTVVLQRGQQKASRPPESLPKNQWMICGFLKMPNNPLNKCVQAAGEPMEDGLKQHCLLPVKYLVISATPTFV